MISGKIFVTVGGTLAKQVSEMLIESNAVFHVGVMTDDPFVPQELAIVEPEEYMSVMKSAKPDALVVFAGWYDKEVIREGAKYADKVICVQGEHIKGVDHVYRVECECKDSCVDRLEVLMQD